MADKQRKTLGLTLSGGGFRATFFHLGVIRFLYEAKLLGHVTHICSVSGGSILAAHLVANWEKYTGDDAHFHEAALEVASFARGDLRGNVVRPWLVSWIALCIPRLLRGRRWWRTCLLERQYQRLYGKKVLHDIDRDDRPQLHILATSMNTGQMVSFGESQMRINEDPQAKRVLNEASTLADEVPLALAVAASSAFPPLFPPVEVNKDTFQMPASKMGFPQYLADGGVFDNLGTRKLLWITRENNISLDLVVISDAQPKFTEQLTNEYSFIWGRTGRSVDLMMDRISGFENSSIESLCRETQSQFLECRLQEVVDPKRSYALTGPEQFALQNVRTDLDEFTKDEINGLIHQGFAVACCRWDAAKTSGQITLGDPPAGASGGRETVWHPFELRSGIKFRLGDAGKRRWGLFRFHDWYSWALWFLIFIYTIGIPGGVVGWLLYKNVKADSERRLAERQRGEVENVLKTIELVHTLGDVALASGTDELRDRVTVWNNLRDSVYRDPRFFRLHKSAEIVLISIKKEIDVNVPDRHKLQCLNLELAHAIRDCSMDNDQKTFRMILRQNQTRWYAEVIDIAKRMTNDGTKLEQIPIGRRRFWQLYWGELGLVEGSSVERAMVTFGDCLKGWEKKEKGPVPSQVKDGLKDAAEKLQSACKEELEEHSLLDP
jgi:predicted acylesterase/phospholipase RssA